ncbi:MAG: LptF/LptG family permease [Chitinophagaceae bacterium]
MFKKLDLLILRAFIGPFLATFLIATFVLVMQFFWLYIDDLIGKGLDMMTIAKLIACVAATTVPLALPIAILLSSIMTFGNLGESFELVAIKSAGIPLLRFMRPVLIVSILISGVAFLFANNVIPVANLKLNALKYDFTFSKPAFDIKEGIFYDKLEGYVLKVGSKDKDGPGIYNVMIYEQNNAVQNNLITSESGIMKVSDDKRSLEFIMKKGTRYEERGLRNSTNTDFIRMGFDEYRKELDLSALTPLKTADSVFKDNYKMKSIRQLNKFTDSLVKQRREAESKMYKEIFPLFKFSGRFDGGWAKELPVYKTAINKLDKKETDSVVKLVYQLCDITVRRMNKPVADSIRQLVMDTYNNTVVNFDAIVPDTLRSMIAETANNLINAAKGNMDVIYTSYYDRRRDIRMHDIEWHRKFALSAACMVLFLIGAPLGSIIRKGGIGTPLIIAIIFFVLFHLMNTFGEKFVKEDLTNPLVGMWLATFVLIPVGVFLTYKAMRDSQLFNKEFYFRTFRRFSSWVKENSKSKEQEPSAES